jgi:hypothetical protein
MAGRGLCARRVGVIGGGRPGELRLRHGGIAHLGPGQVTLRNAIVSALFLWLGFVVTTMAVNNAFGQRKASLTIIDGIHWLGVLVIQGAIIGAMGV